MLRATPRLRRSRDAGTALPEELQRPAGHVPRSGTRLRRLLDAAGSAAASSAASAAALMLTLAVLVMPDRPDQLSAITFARLPVEIVLIAGLALLLPRRTARVLGAVAGAVLGLLAVGALLDLGFVAVLVRPFDPVPDWVLMADAVEFLASTMGRPAALGIATAAGVLAVALVVLATSALVRTVGLVARHRAAATPAVVVMALIWTTAAALEVRTGPDRPVAANVAMSRAEQRALQIRQGLDDRTAFAAATAQDAFADVPGDELLTGLSGKDVLVAFVESYGRSAVENPALSPRIDALLDDGTRRLRARGFRARSAYLTSPTFGGSSWLAHSTLQSGLWINSQQRYRSVTASDRFTLSGAFRRAGWRTVGVMPGVTRAWPEGRLYDFDQIYDSRQMGYRGPNFGWAPMPDQYALATYLRTELSKQDRPSLMAELPLVSSHGPWAPLPQMVGWDEVGDGSVFGPMAAQGQRPDDVLSHPVKMRAAYSRSVEYSLHALLSFVERYGDDRTVVVFLGDHQPAPVVAGPGAGRDVPVTIVARDPAVLDRISAWGWQEGLRPRPGAPVWRMDTFRDRFLAAFR